jgi:large subunit ribosomal protein L7A
VYKVLDELKAASSKVVGIKQLRRALTSGSAKKVFLAEDADPMLTEPIAKACQESGTALEYVQTMKQLGAACAISVSAAAAAII